MERLFFVDIHYACFCIISVDNIIVDCAPIVKWMKGKTLQQVKQWLLNKQAKVIEI